MRRTAADVQTQRSQSLPRGWIILGAALASWALFAALWAGSTQLFQFVLSAT